MVCPSEIACLMERCLDADVQNRPAFREIIEILAKVYMIIMILLHIVHGCIILAKVYMYMIIMILLHIVHGCIIML